MTNNTLLNLKNLPFGGVQSIDNPSTLLAVADILSNCVKFLKDETVNKEFLGAYQTWIKSTKNNSFIGLEKFNQAVYISGTTEGFDKFYMKNHRRRFRCFRGEYMYHQLTWRNHWPDWKYIEDLDITSNDAVVISMPFADNGKIHKLYHPLMKLCTDLGVPVLVDSAYFGVCSNIEFVYDYDCITDITFSLSKTFPVSYVRTGMRLSKQDDDDPSFVYHKTNYTNRLGAGLGLNLIKQFSSDYIANTYQQTQRSFCQQLGVDISNSVFFGIDETGLWTQYNRGADTNRLCLSQYLVNGQLPTNK